MSEDVIEFGPASTPQRRPKLRHLPRLPQGAALPTAAIGSIGLIASLVGNWQSTTFPVGPEEFREVGSAVAALGSVGGAFVVIAVATAASVVITLFGQPSQRSTARLLGYTLATAGLVLVSTIGYTLTKTSYVADFQLLPRDDMPRVEYNLEWGFYVAFAGLLALGAALVLSVRPSPSLVGEAAQYEEPLEMELEVTVFPASPKAGPGEGHELYMRP